MMLSIYPRSAMDMYKKIRINYSPSIDAACDEIYKATTGLGTDDDMLIKILGPRTPNDRAMISYRYKEMYNQNLRDLIKSETSGDFGFLLQLACMSLPEAESYIIHRACKGVGTSDNLLYPIILGRSNDELSVLKKTFYDMYAEDLAVMLNGELSGDFHQIITMALQENQIEFKSSFHTSAKAMEDAEAIYKAGEGKWGTDEGKFVKVLLSCPPQHLVQVNKAYMDKYKKTLVDAIQSEFSGSSSDALCFHVRMFLEPFNLLADNIESSMAGIGTDETLLCSTLFRYHGYLNHIKPVYEQKFKTTIRERVDGETSGKLHDLLMHIVETPASHGAYA